MLLKMFLQLTKDWGRIFASQSFPIKKTLSSLDFVKALVYLCCSSCTLEGVVVQCYNPLTLQPEQPGGQGSILDRAVPFERYDKE